ncbi:hypothetical protein PILCRDRAFT_38676, partial [Piloderma croceum F 1598]
SATIAAFAKLSINKFKNLNNNPCIYSDTDSVILEKELSDIFVGKEIGNMKLEHKIKQGVFPRKKLYAIIDNNDKVIIKAAGANSNL